MRAGGGGARERLARYGPLLLTLCAGLLWAASLHTIDLARMNDLGLVSVFPLPVFIALAFVVASFCLSLSRPRLDERVLLVHVSMLIVMLYGVTALIEREPRFPIVWIHTGIIEYILRTGHVDPNLSAYFNWPGFFILNALVTRVTGVSSMLDLAAWAPLLFNLLYLGPLLMVLNAATGDKRLVWLGVWFFYLTNWIGQDYFSPQGLNYFFYLVIVGILLLYFKAPARANLLRGGWMRLRAVLPGWPGRAVKPADAGPSRLLNVPRMPSSPVLLNVPRVPSTPVQRAALIVIVMVLDGVIVFSHQLTPFVALASVSLLILFRCCTPRSLPLFMLVALLGWISFMTTAFLSGNIGMFIHGAGSVHNVVSANLLNRIQGSPQHVFIVRMRLVMTAGIWVVAALGGLRRLWHGAWDLPYVLLAIAPFPLLVLQTYGGEMLLRVYLFALPAVVFFMAALFYTRTNRAASWRTTGAAGALSVAVLGGFLFARYGNERMDYYTVGEVRALQQLYRIARPGAIFTAFTNYMPLLYRDIEQYDVEADVLDRLRSRHEDVALLDRGDASGVVRLLHGFCPRPSYFVLLRSNVANMELFDGVSTQQAARAVRALTTTSALAPVFDDGDAAILTLTGGCAGHTLFGIPVAAGSAAPHGHGPGAATTAPHRHTRPQRRLFGVSVGAGPSAATRHDQTHRRKGNGGRSGVSTP